MHAISIFAIAFIVRALLGYIFYGSIDVSAFISINQHTFNNTLVLHPFTIWYSFPIIPFYLWLCGLLCIKTPLPVAFCFKIIPIIFDSFLAVLVYNFVQKIRPHQAIVSGYLYALSPVALIITCIHGQWDALPLFFLLLAFFIRDFHNDSITTYFLYGAFFAFSFLLKPIALIFLPFFFVPWLSFKQHLGKAWTYLCVLLVIAVMFLIGFFIFFKFNTVYSMDRIIADLIASLNLWVGLMVGFIVLCFVSICLLMIRNVWESYPLPFKQYLTYQSIALAGLFAMIAVCFLFLGLYGFNLIKVVDKVLRYCNQGIAVFGLPFAYPCNQGILYLILKNRFWIMGVICLVAFAYYKQRIDVYNAILTSLMIVFSFSKLSPQYLLWAVPLLLITGWYRIAAVFSAVCSVFFILYYMNPYANMEVLYQSMLSFAPLQGWNWLLPPTNLNDIAWLPLIRVVGNYGIPMLCCAIALVVLLYSSKLSIIRSKRCLWSVYMFLVFFFLLTLMIAVLMLMVDSNGFGVLFRETVAMKTSWYAICTIDGYSSGCYGQGSSFHIVAMLLVLTGIWSMLSMMVHCGRNRS